ncbi:hypothetical protein EJ03DRAFT_28332 [Teratosphaeria nubilosa]|uniref:C3H1-type domain-containing protein n=1 Tax=Teratosphaeria nubilosa TaxID=161662 RepID=A0A6G1KVW0_9PEZI|nr:hypothetical protein EJ03DRAFT_28332 [Teratosphaeria nubilosa]
MPRKLLALVIIQSHLSCALLERTGECDCTKRGCLYKHEMADRATLRETGTYSTPRWWSDKQTFPTYLLSIRIFCRREEK